MKRILCLLLTLGIATTAMLPSLHAHAQDATQEVKLYLNRAPDGSLALSEHAPSARNATTWTLSGQYHTAQGLQIRIPLHDPNPNWVIDEAQGVSGWITYDFEQRRATGSPFVSYNYGTFEWLLVQGERSAPMIQECVTPNQTYEYSCDAYRYAADFPGHSDQGVPHTHGDGSDAARGLLSGDLEWVLAYTVPPCDSLWSLCPLGTSMRYDFSVLLDGTTFLDYVAIDEQHPLVDEPVPEAASNETANETAEQSGTAAEDPDVGDGTGNETGSDSEGNAFRPRAYDAQHAEGTAPGAGLVALLVTLGVAAGLRRRRA